MPKEGIAIIGIGCRFPGGVNNAEEFWKLLVDGREAVCEVPSDRWNVERFYDAEPGITGKSIAKRGGFLDSIDQFDPQFFGISPREAPYVDPQQRLLLETAWEAIEDAGIVLDLEKGTDIAVFVGISHNDYQGLQGTPWDHSGISAHSATGSAHSIAANRISYSFNLHGPSVALDTACSSALTAVHVACDHIWAGRGETAMAGGVTVMITPGGFIGFSQAAMLSPDGRCKAFDASADGFVRGEGAGMVLLKRLSRAIEDGDPIHGVIIGTAMNQDGRTNGLSLPSAEAQARVVRDACADASIAPSRIGFVEAHGTGTAVGDPIEAHALAEALCADRDANVPLPIGSVKTNLGHLETAAGIAGLIKAVLVLKHGTIPATLHFHVPNPYIDFKALKLRVPTAVEKFPSVDGPRIAGVNSFGFGGSNSHVIVTEPPPLSSPKRKKTHPERTWPIMLSARSEASLLATAKQLGTWLEAHSFANGTSSMLPDLLYTLGARRNHHAYRFALTGSSTLEIAKDLLAFGSAEPVPKARTAFAPRGDRSPRVAFIMSGQGPQWWGMGRELIRHEPVFRRTIESCAKAMKPWLRFSLEEEFARAEENTQMHRTEIAQPAIFAMQMAVAELWKSWGVQPAAIAGHSVGEVAAACVAGVLSLDQAAQVIALRSRFMEECARGEGTMLAVGLTEDEGAALIAEHDHSVTVSVCNGPKSVTLSGPHSSLEKIQGVMESRGVFARFVKVDHPFHHPLMQPAASALRSALAELAPRKEVIPFFSTVTGTQLSGDQCDAAYWASGVRNPVRFAQAVKAIDQFGVDIWLEISAHPALAHSINECLMAGGPGDAKTRVMSSVRREREHESLLETALGFHLAGVAINFAAMTPSRRVLSLPTYDWDRNRWWSEAQEWKEARHAPGGRGLLDSRLPRAMPIWSARLDERHMSFLKDHKVGNLVVFPAAAYVEMVLEAGTQIFEGRPFVVEDFEIRKPLILPEPISELLLEISYDPNERTFLIQSRIHHSTAWSVHVVGSMRAERTQSARAILPWNASNSVMTPVDLGGFYNRMGDMGLSYGEEFRPIRELYAANSKSRGRVSLSNSIAHRASDYQLHPVLFDGALQVFSAGAASADCYKEGLKLPVRFGRILFLRSPGSSSLVKADVLKLTDEFIEGSLGLYNEAGEPCVLVKGFRSISMSGVRLGSMHAGKRDLLYHVDWHRTAAFCPQRSCPPAPLHRIKKAAREALEEVIDLRGRDRLQAAMAAADELASARIALALREMGVCEGSGAIFTADSLKVVERMRSAFNQMCASLVGIGLLVAVGPAYRPTSLFDSAADSAEKTLRSYLAHHPGHLPDGLLCTNAGSQLGSVLRGEQEAVQVLFSRNDLLEQFYGDGLLTSHWLAAIAAAVREAARKLPEGRGLRILEVGAGTGGLSAYVLPLLERGLHSYIFSDVSAGFFPAAMQRFSAFPEVEYKLFDLEKPGTEQGFEVDNFDLVIGTNVLHAVCDVHAALRHIHDLLKPGGTMIFMDVAVPHLWTESVFGFTGGWWRFSDYDLRPSHPLLQRSQWESALRRVGFIETGTLTGLLGRTGSEGQIGLLARKAWEEPTVTEDTSSDLSREPVENSWLVFADTSGVGDDLVQRLRASGTRCRVARSGDQFKLIAADDFALRTDDPGDWKQLMEACFGMEEQPEHIVYLWSLNELSQQLGEKAVLMGTDALLHLIQATNTARPAAKLRMDLVTRGAQPVGGEMPATAVSQAPAIGLLRVIQNEYPNFSCRAIDLPPHSSDYDSTLLWSELLQTDSEREVALRGEARYVQRLVRGLPSGERLLDPSAPVRLESRERGHLDTLHFTAFSPPVCEPGQVMIEVKAAGMNFRDVLKALALYPGEATDASIFGDEVAGLVKAVGSGVTDIFPGDKVFGLAHYGLATHAFARGGDLCRIPIGLSFEEATTLPVVFMTAWHSIRNVARMRKGESILIHAGAGGVGMAAIQIANHLGVEVIATAGTPAKRDLLKKLGVLHVIDSRNDDFADEVMEITGGRGVDAVLNSLATEAIPMGLSCLAEFGRFIEIGKRDIYQNSRIPLRPLRNNGSYHVVAMDAVFGGDEILTKQMLVEIAGLVEKGALHPLPFRSFPACRVDSAFRLMAQGKHTGKIVVAFPGAFLPDRAERTARALQIKSDGCYLITGGGRGFGRVLAEWLASRGARHIILASRSGGGTPEAEAFLQKLQSLGATAVNVCADVSSPDDIARLMEEIRSAGHPLKGVFHLAMTIDDAPLAELTSERLRNVMGPKAYGAWLLHEATRDITLDFFVMFSSVSSLFGNPAQGNYAAANAFLDSLAHHRRALNLPALTVNWGVLGGEGYVARNERVEQFLAKQGTSAISPREVVSFLESFLAADFAQVMAIRVDWTKWHKSFRSLQQNPLFERILAAGAESSEAPGAMSDWRAKIESASPEERGSVIANAVRDIIAAVLRVKPESLRDDQPLTDLGLDSLMGVEIENSLEAAVGIALPPTSLLRARNIGQISTIIAGHMGENNVPCSKDSAVPFVSVRETDMVEQVDLTALSDNDLDQLLGTPVGVGGTTLNS